MNRLFLVRHGENTANLTLEFSHRKVDYSLTPKGQLQAAQTAEYFKSIGVDAIYTSPLKRAVETAQAIAEPFGCPVIVLEAFREVNVGELEGQKPTPQLWSQHNAIIAAWMDGHPETCFPGGEDFHVLLRRAKEGFESVLRGSDGRNLVIVGHGGIFTFTMRYLIPGFDRDILDRGMANCSITEIAARLVGEKIEAQMVSYAAVGHLSGEAAKLVTGLMDTSQSEA